MEDEKLTVWQQIQEIFTCSCKEDYKGKHEIILINDNDSYRSNSSRNKKKSGRNIENMFNDDINQR